MNIASLIIVRRSLIAQYWAALSHDQTRTPPRCVWVLRMRSALFWLRAFLTEMSGPLLRTYPWQHKFGTDCNVIILIDASPFCIGSWVSISGVVP